MSKGKPLLRWQPNGCDSGVLGFAGNVSEWVFQIWRPHENRQWELICNLPGNRTTAVGNDDSELKDTAERWLRWFLTDVETPPKWSGGRAST